MNAPAKSFALLLSLGANFLLLGVVGLLLCRERPVSPTFSGPTKVLATPATATATPAVAPAAPPSFTPVPATPTPTGLTPAAVAELEQTGIPRDILVSVLLADLNRRWTAQGVALQKKYAPEPVPERELRALSRQSVAEQARELQAALGAEGYHTWDKEQALLTLNRARPPGDALPMNAAEEEQAYRLQKAFDDENRELQEAMEDGAADATDIGKLQAKAQRTLDEGLENLLGKQRFDALRGNGAPLAQTK